MAKIKDGTVLEYDQFYIREFVRMHNATHGKVHTWQGAAAVAHPEAVKICESEHFEAGPKANLDDAERNLRGAAQKLDQARFQLGEKLKAANEALKAQDLTQDAIDFLGIAGSIAGIFLSGGAGLAVAAGGTLLSIANDYSRPGAPGLNEAGGQTLGVIDTGASIESTVARVGLRHAGTVGSVIAGIHSIVEEGPQILATSIYSSEQLRSLLGSLDDVEPTQIRKWFGLDKDELKKLINEALAAEEAFQKAFLEWAAALRARDRAPGYEGTCIYRVESQITRAIYDGPEG